MKTVGIRDAKNKLSAYVRDAQRGRVIRITDRGRVVAELRAPATSAGPEALYDELVAQGKIVPPRTSKRRRILVPRGKPRLPAGLARDLIDADRAERP